MSEKHAGGRPPIFNSPEEMEALIDEYIKSGEVLTVTGLALKLGFCSRQSIYDYENKPEFSYIVARGRLFVENGYEKCLYGKYANGATFALKNMGWADKQEITLTDLQIGKPPTLEDAQFPEENES